MREPSLLTTWEISLRKKRPQIEWDLIILPLLFGPVYITDNMLIDNEGLIEALKKDWVRELLDLYAELGLFKILVRKTWGRNNPINNIHDLLMIWLSRSDIESNKTYEMASINSELNEEIRNIIISNDGQSVTKCCTDYLNENRWGQTRSILKDVEKL